MERRGEPCSGRGGFLLTGGMEEKILRRGMRRGKGAVQEKGGKNTHAEEYTALWFSLALQFANTFMLHRT